MALEKTFQGLNTQLKNLREALSELRVSIEDRPPDQDVLLIDRLSDAVEDLFGWAAEAGTESAEGVKAVGHPLDLDRARRALVNAQQRFNRLMQHFTAELSDYERIDCLIGLGRERGGEWQDWVDLVKESIDRCQQSLYDVSEAFFQCWQEIAERVGTMSVSVQSTNIGQHITAPKDEEYARAHFP